MSQSVAQGSIISMGKLNWSCTTCGMSSGRKYPVQRHIDNSNIHNGYGKVIPFVEYTIGRREGKYQPSQAPNTRAPRSAFLDEIYVKAGKEAENLIVKDIAFRIYNDVLANPARLDDFKRLTIAYLYKKGLSRLFDK